MTSTEKEEGGVMRFWAILQMVEVSFWGRGYLSDFVDAHIFKQEIPFFHHVSGFLKIIWLTSWNFFCSWFQGSIMETP